MRSYSSAVRTKAERIWLLSAALLVVIFTWVSAVAAWPAPSGLSGEETAIGQIDHGPHPSMHEDCCGDVEGIDSETCMLASICSFCAPAETVLRDHPISGPERLAPGLARRLAGLTVLPPDHPPRPLALV